LSNTNTIAWSTNGTYAARIDPNQCFISGTTTPSAGYGLTYVRATFYGGAGYVGLMAINTDATSGTIMVQNSATSGDNVFQYFITEATNTGVVRGSIDYNRAGGLTRYNTTSDYRAKTVKGPVLNAVDRVMQLKPCTGRMNGATEDIDFFVAHELQEIVPSAVSGAKDEMDQNGKPLYQKVDKSALIPLMVAAIQELQNQIVELKKV
jgi:hypothetical protein